MASEKQGYLGNLEEKSIQELKELLTREENILRKKKFVSSLPDKGKKNNWVQTETVGFNQQKAESVSWDSFTPDFDLQQWGENKTASKSTYQTKI